MASEYYLMITWNAFDIIISIKTCNHAWEFITKLANHLINFRLLKKQRDSRHGEDTGSTGEGNGGGRTLLRRSRRRRRVVPVVARCLSAFVSARRGRRRRRRLMAAVTGSRSRGILNMRRRRRRRRQVAVRPVDHRWRWRRRVGRPRPAGVHRRRSMAIMMRTRGVRRGSSSSMTVVMMAMVMMMMRGAWLVVTDRSRGWSVVMPLWGLRWLVRVDWRRRWCVVAVSAVVGSARRLSRRRPRGVVVRVRRVGRRVVVGARGRRRSQERGGQQHWHHQGHWRDGGGHGEKLWGSENASYLVLPSKASAHIYSHNSKICFQRLKLGNVADYLSGILGKEGNLNHGKTFIFMLVC